MKATINSTSTLYSAPTRNSTGGYWNCKKTAEFLGLSLPAIRLMFDSGELQGDRTRGGHRRVSSSSARFVAFGVEDYAEQSQDDSPRTCCYLRVSSEKQRASGSLENQKELVLDEVEKRYGLTEDQVIVIKECRSSFSSRDGLNRIIEMAIEGKIDRVICSYRDRWSRVGALSRLTEFIFKKYGVELVYLFTEDEDDPESTVFNVQELVEFVTVIGAKNAGAKSARVNTHHLKSETIDRMMELRRKNMGVKGIVKVLAKENHRVTRNGKDGPHPSRFLLNKWLDNNGNEMVLNATVKPVKEESVIERFKRQCLIEKEGEKVKVGDVYSRYQKWCEDRELVVEPVSWFSRLLGLPKIKQGHYRWYTGVVLT